MHYCTSMPIPVVPLLLVLAVATMAAVAAPSPSGSDTDAAALLDFKAKLADPLGVLRDNWTSATL